MAYSLSQSVQSSASGTSITVSLSAVNQTDLVIVHAKFGGSAGMPSSAITITDNASIPNTYTVAVDNVQVTGSGGFSLSQFYGVAFSGGATSVTVSWTTAASARITVDVYTGDNAFDASILDVAASATGTGGTASVSLSPSASGYLVVASGAFSGVTGVSASSGYTLATNNTNASSEYNNTATTSETPGFTLTGTSQKWAMAAVSYKSLPNPPVPIRLDQLTPAGDVVDLNSHNLINVTDPSNAQDAATKNYVDAHSFSSPMTTLGDIIYENSTPAAARLAGNTTTTRKFFRQVGNGTISAAPAWDTLVAGDLPTALQNGTTATTQSSSDNSTKLATTAYTDAAVSVAVQGLSIKPSADVATTTTLPSYTYSNGSSGVGATITALATGVVAIDGHNLALGDIVLVKDETSTNAPNNGLYTVTVAGAVGVALILTRHADMDETGEFKGGFVFVSGGTVNASAGFVCTNTSAVTVGTTNVAFQQFSGAGEITAGTGLSKSGNTLSIDTSVTVDKTTAQVLTNKDVKSATNTFAAVTTTSSSSTPSPTGDSRENELYLTAQAATATFAAPSGTPANGNKLFIRIKDNGGAQTLNWNAIYVNSGAATLPAVSVAGKTLSVFCKYDSTAVAWVCLASDTVGY